MRATPQRKAELVARASVIVDGLRKAKVKARLVEIGLFTDADDTLCFDIFSRRNLDKVLLGIFEKWEDVTIVSDRPNERSGRRELAVSFENGNEFANVRDD